MSLRIGINGFGRIGRLALRSLWSQVAAGEVTLVRINDPGGDAATFAHLLEFDSVHGQWAPGQVGGGYELGAGGGWGNEPGFGWYRTELPLTKRDMKRKFKYLHFSACDEDAWVYLNGTKIFDHTLEEAGLLSSEIWIAPFVVSLNDVKLRGDDLLAVRIRNTEGMGGIWKPVDLVLTDQKLTDQQVKALITVRMAKE